MFRNLVFEHLTSLCEFDDFKHLNFRNECVEKINFYYKQLIVWSTKTVIYQPLQQKKILGRFKKPTL
jgi:hypothetical protein